MTFNQGVTGSKPVRPTALQLCDYPNGILLSRFLNARRQGISPRTLEFYQTCLKRFLSNYKLTSTDINTFLSNLDCRNGKNAYYRAIRCFCNWLYRQGLIKDNPITRVDPPKMTRVILPSLKQEQVEYLIQQADSIRDKAIISLFADSGIRLSELVNIKSEHVEWSEHTVTVWGKGGKQRKAPFTNKTAELLRQVVASANGYCNIWGTRRRGTQIMLYRLQRRQDCRVVHIHSEGRLPPICIGMGWISSIS